MGVGFFNPKTEDPIENPPYDSMVKGGHRFIRGNHDNPGVCKNHTQWIPDGTYDNKHGMFFVGGALSIDAEFRLEHFSWWRNEECSYDSFQNFISLYSFEKPKIMVTHDCPENVASYLFKGGRTPEFPSITRQALQIMLDIHKPKLWIFGHWHEHRNQVIDGCRFICLSELQHIDLEI